MLVSVSTFTEDPKLPRRRSAAAVMPQKFSTLGHALEEAEFGWLVRPAGGPAVVGCAQRLNALANVSICGSCTAAMHPVQNKIFWALLASLQLSAHQAGTFHHYHHLPPTKLAQIVAHCRRMTHHLAQYEPPLDLAGCVSICQDDSLPG